MGKITYFHNFARGGVFLIAYITILIILGVPCFFLESAYGQMFKRKAHEFYSRLDPKMMGLTIA